MRFHAWKRHEIIVWNHMVPCIESHGRLMNLDPGMNKKVFVLHTERAALTAGYIGKRSKTQDKCASSNVFEYTSIYTSMVSF